VEASRKQKSVSKFLQLTDIVQLNEYTTILEKCMNSPHKYNLIGREIKTDQFGDPYTISQYIEIEEVPEKIKLKGKIFGQIINVVNLQQYDDLFTDHVEKKIKIFFSQDFITGDKIAPVYYKILLYVKPLNGMVIDEIDISKIKPLF